MLIEAYLRIMARSVKLYQTSKGEMLVRRP